ncbi:MAG: hypothetical protein KGL35_18555, partial [Bradyrhizobium sp.]|nr:hypothetical protein [Bradyrhizobium sp.]
MAVNSLNDYSTTPSSNADIAGTNIAIGCPPQDVGVFMRTIMAQIAYAVQGTGGPIPATWNVGTLTAASISSASSFTVSGTLSATTVAASGNITVGGTLTAASIGGVSSLSVAGVTASAGVTSTGYDAGGANFRATNGSYGVFLRNDGTTANLLQTASGSPTGTFNTFRPLSWNLGSGAVTIDGTAAGATMGGALTVGGLLTTSALSVSGTSAFTGATTAPTVGAGTNNASVATAAFVQNAMLGGTGQSWTDVTASRA